MRNLIVALALFVAASAARAQVTIDPGMSRDVVVQRLGKPISERVAGGQSFLFYANGCEKKCGMNDLVVLENDAVVDAIFRSPRHHYSGQSSSPTGTTPTRSRPTEARMNAAAANPARGNLVIGGDTPRPKSGAQPRQARKGTADSSAADAIVVEDTSAADRPVQPVTTGPSVFQRYQSGAPTTSANPQAASPAPPRAGTINGTMNDSAAMRAHSPMSVSPNPGTPQVPLPDSTSSPATPITPGQRPAPFVGARPNPTDSARMAQQKRQQPDSTKPPEE